MRSLSFALLLIFALAPDSAKAASYQRIDGTIIDPIAACCQTPTTPTTPTTAHPYAGVDVAPGADLSDANLSSADLRDADLRDANLWFANFQNADLSGANMTDSENWQGSFAGANFTGAVWRDSGISETNISGANFSSADLSGFFATESYAGGSSFVNANLAGSSLSISAPNADFTDANLRGARFFEEALVPDLSGAIFAGADLTNVSFDNDFGITLPRISLADADFSNAVLQNAIGLGNTLGAAIYDSQTDFSNAWADLGATIPFDPVAAGWTFVPEPGTALLMGLGLAGLSRRRG